jgi:hypothetical protein
MAAHAPMLKVVTIPFGENLSTVDNISYLFTRSGVTAVYGMGYLSHIREARSIFYGCNLLQTTDFRYPHVTADGVLNHQFCGCYNLSGKISDMFFTNKISNGTMNVEDMFRGCNKLEAEDLGVYLWNNKNVTWTRTTNVFTDCSPELRALVPKSWGGTG